MDPRTHLQHLRMVLEWFQKHGLIINPSKCEFAKSKIDFLGYHLTSAGAVPLLKHVEAVYSFPTLVDKLHLQRFFEHFVFGWFLNVWKY